MGNKLCAVVEPLRGGLALALERALGPGEEVLVCLQGGRGEALVALADRLLILKAGFPSGAWFGWKVKVFPYWGITSVEVGCGALQGRVQVTAAGSVEEQHGYLESDPLDGYVAAVQAENVVTFPAWKRERFEEAVRVIWSLVEGAKRGAVAG